MTIKDKYGISTRTWQAMIRDGVIPCKVSRAEEIISCYVKKKQSGLSHTESVVSTAYEMKCSCTWVYEVIRKYK
jgi:hypothetical protein